MQKSYDLFLAVPMSSIPEAEYAVLRRDTIRAISSWRARKPDLAVFCPMLGISETVNFDTPQAALKMDCDAIRASRRLVAVYPGKINTSMTWEAGYAFGLEIPVTILCRKVEDLPFLMQGMPGIRTFQGLDEIVRLVEETMFPPATFVLQRADHAIGGLTT